MALSELEMARVRKSVGAFIEQSRPAPHIRSKVDVGYRILGQSVVIFEVRPVWRGPPGKRMEHGVAKATYVRTRDVWRVFWQRANLKWHGYEPAPEVVSIDDFLFLVRQDAFACFWG
jgi:Protein of unknown function (DUF3024)